MTAPTLLITIDRTSLALSPLVLSGSDDSNDLGVTDYRPPALQSRVTYMPDSVDVDGSEAIAASWQQSILGFSYVASAADESDAQASYAEVVAAIGQFSYTVTTQVSGAPAEVWSADRGSIALASGNRSFVDLAHACPVYAVSIPVYPISEASP